MTDSNYPPGVTGNEPEIAGYPEVELTVTCDRVDQFVSLRRVWEILSSAWETNSHADKILDLEKIEEDCGFAGDVTAVVDGGMAYWECPWCDQDCETELDDGGDF